MISGNINSTYFSVYNCGEMIVAHSSFSYFYFSWLTSSESGMFWISGTKFYIDRYSGLFSFNMYSSLVSNIKVRFSECTFSYFETNLPYIDASSNNFVFDHCYSLKIANLYNCISLGDRVFIYQTVETVNLPICQEIGKNAFFQCRHLSSIYLPECLNVSEYAFYDCRSISTAYIPKCESIGSHAFNTCHTLSSIDLPNCSYIGIEAFGGCINLSTVNLYDCSYLGTGVFDDCSSLTILRLEGSSVCVLDDELLGTAFSGTQIALSHGGIYVPSSLVNDYKTAMYWSSLSNNIYPIQ